ncbi:MAG: GAF domain-containing sensor histidine kinase [Microcoleus sp.]
MNAAPMLMPASSEFVKLCRSQVAIAVSLGATFSAVYLTEELVSGTEAKLIPIAVYPESPAEREEDRGHRLRAQESSALETAPQRRLQQAQVQEKPIVGTIAPESLPDCDSNANRCASPEDVWQQRRQIIAPLIHEGAVMGLLVSGRQDRAWDDREEAQMQQIARSLALACILDQRSQWVEQELGQQRQLQTQVYDTMHNLLHQFKSPLTALRTFGKLLARRLLAEDKNRDAALSIVRESDRLQELLLQFDRTVDAGEANLRVPSGESKIAIPDIESIRPSVLSLSPGADVTSNCSVAGVLQPLLVSAEAIASDRNLKLLANIPADLPPIRADDRALREVLSNLIENALKYTPVGEQIFIEVRSIAPDSKRSPDSKLPQIAVAVSDTGTGIPPQDLEHLFERHYRGAKAHSEIPGTGLGLAIANDLVSQMQGKIEVFSPINLAWLPPVQPPLERRDCGTTFVVLLPVNLQ